MASCRGPSKILRECKGTTSPELLAQLKKVLHHHNLKNHIGYVIEDQRRQSRAHENHASIPKNITKIETILSKEERSKCVEVFTCWLENIFPTRIVFEGSFSETLFSTCADQFDSTTD